MKLSYFLPALFVTVCVACPGTRHLTEEQLAEVKNPHNHKPLVKKFATAEAEIEFHKANPKVRTAGKKTLDRALGNPVCPLGTTVSSAANSCAAYNYVYPIFQSYITENDDVFTLSTLYGAAVRLAFHDAGEVDITQTDDNGPDGCLSNADGNAGLVEDWSIVVWGFQPVWEGICDKISRADFWVMLAKMSIEAAEPTGTITIDFQWGRKDNTNGCDNYNRLPGGESDVDDMYQVFVTRMGMTLNDASTLLGAHTVGHMHTYASGYGLSNVVDGYTNGFDDTPHVFDNNYFYNMMVNTWTSQSAPADSSLVQFLTSQFPQTVLIPADISQGYIRTSYSSFTAQSCGPYAVPVYNYYGYRTGYTYGCTPSSTIMPLTCWQNCNHGNSNSYFLSEFRTAFSKMTCAGYGVPARTNGASASGKLGTLYHLDLGTC